MIQDRRGGIVLIFIIGLIVLPLILALNFQLAVRLQRQAWTVRGSRLQAELTSASGVEYTAARLGQTRHFPAVATTDNRGDDWHCRDATWKGVPSPRFSPDPSYAHVVVGRDGAIDSASGRLRGAQGPCFSLRVTSVQERICVNAGFLPTATGDHDLDGVPNADDAEFILLYKNVNDYDVGGGGFDLWAGELPNGVPDYRDPDFSGNAQIVSLLDTLGAVIGLSDTAVVPYSDDPSAAHLNSCSLVHRSQLGRRVIASRPVQGYSSVEELRSVLGPDDYVEASPYLSIRGEIVPVVLNLFHNKGPSGYESFLAFEKLFAPDGAFYDSIQYHQRLDLNGVSREVLAACLRNLTASGAWLDIQRVPPSNYGFSDEVRIKSTFVRLSEGEADAAAACLVAARPIRTWRRLLEVLHQNRPVFQDDPFTAEVDDQHLLKEDLILAQFNANGGIPDARSWRANSLEVPREDPAVGVDDTRGIQIMKPLLYSTGDLATGFRRLATIPFDAEGTPADWGRGYVEIPPRPSTEFVLMPALGQFTVESEGWREGKEDSSFLSAELEMEKGSLTLSSQWDFEQMDEPGFPLPRRFPKGDLAAVTGAQVRAGMQSYPAFPRRAFRNGAWHANFSDTPDQARDSRTFGWLQLAVRQWTDSDLTDGGAVTGALPFNEDGDPGAGNLYDAKIYDDNVVDPMKRGSGDSSKIGSNSMWGIGWGPSGFRSTETANLYWQDTAFNLAAYDPSGREDYTARPPPVPRGAVEEGMIVMRFPRWGAEFCQGPDKNPFVMPNTESNVKLFRTQEYYDTVRKRYQTRSHDHLLVTYDAAADSLRVRNFLVGPGGADRTIPSPDLAPTTSPWRTVVVLFDKTFADTLTPTDKNDTACVVWVDGDWEIPVSDPLLLDNGQGSPLQEAHFTLGMECVVDGPVDDLFVRRDKDTAWMDTQIAADRFCRNGIYRSPMYRFDLFNLPRGGGALMRIGWDAFFPRFSLPTPPGSIRMTVQGFDGNGQPLPPVSVVYTGADYSANVLQEQEIRVPSCREFYVEVEMDAGAAPSPLQDSPILDELRVVYGENRGRPCFTHYGVSGR